MSAYTVHKLFPMFVKSSLQPAISSFKAPALRDFFDSDDAPGMLPFASYFNLELDYDPDRRHLARRDGLWAAIHAFNLVAAAGQKTADIGVCAWQDITGVMYTSIRDFHSPEGLVDVNRVARKIVNYMEAELKNSVSSIPHPDLSFAFVFDSKIDFRKYKVLVPENARTAADDLAISGIVQSIVDTPTRQKLAELLSQENIPKLLTESHSCLKKAVQEGRLAVFAAPCEVSVYIFII
jgi:hypothetical protein